MKKWFQVIIPYNDYTGKKEYLEFGSDKEIRTFTEKQCKKDKVDIDFGIEIFELTKTGEKKLRPELTKDLRGVREQTVQERRWF